MIIIDECVPRRYLRLLREWGYEVEFASSQLPPDAPDADMIALAKRLNAILLTVDLDFASILDYPPANFTGIIVLRYDGQLEADLDKTLETALREIGLAAFQGALVVISAGRYRVRR
jgi:predicted nuclease of predicted toxin-antitoxin system